MADQNLLFTFINRVLDRIVWYQNVLLIDLTMKKGPPLIK